VDDRKQRLARIVEMFEKVRNPGLVLINKLNTNFTSMVKSILAVRWGKPTFISSGIWTNFVVFVADRKFLGKSYSKFVLHLPLQLRENPIIIGSVTVKDELILCITSKLSIFPKYGDLDNFFDRIESEINAFSELQG
jgi:hypothetical protein